MADFLLVDPHVLARCGSDLLWHLEKLAVPVVFLS